MWVQPGLCDEEWWCGCLSGAGVHWGAECGWRWSSSFSGNLCFWGACLLPTPKWAHGCWVQPRLPARDCKVLLWKGKCVWTRLSSLNFSKMEYCSIFIITLEKHQNKVPWLHAVGRTGFGCRCVDRPHGTGTMSGEAAQAHNSLPWAPGNPLEMLIVESTLICINYANQQLCTAVV